MDNQERDDINRLSGEAGMLLAHPMLNAAFDKIEADTVTLIKTLQFGESSGEIVRDKLMLTLQVIDQVKLNLHEHIEEAQMNAYQGGMKDAS